MVEVYQNRMSIFGPNITSSDSENISFEELDDENWKFLTQDHNFQHIPWSIPNETARFGFDVSTVEWRIGSASILTFRGTFSHGDYANIEHWMTDYLLEKSTNRMKKAWTNDANLKWTGSKKYSNSIFYNMLRLLYI
jgi:hypothetical protein